MNRLHQAAIRHYEARREEAIATLEIYFQRPAGIGEHSDLMAEITKWTEVLANANDCLDDLRSTFNDDGAPR